MPVNTGMKLLEQPVKRTTWKYNIDIKESLRDPRIQLMRHMNWERQNISNHPGRTRWNGTEPDAYNRSIWDKRAHFIEGIKDQCWYKDLIHGGWVSLYVLDDYNKPLFDAYIKENSVWATWSPYKSSAMRTRIPSIVYDHHIKWGKMAGRTDDERLHDLGFYAKLAERGIPYSWIIERTGEPDPLEEVKDQEEEDLDL